MTRLKLRTCQRWAITPGAFDALPEDERLEMMAFTRYQDSQADEFKRLLIEREMLEPTAAAVLVTRGL